MVSELAAVNADFKSKSKAKTPASRWRFLVVFLTVQAVLFTAELWQPVRSTIVDPFTASLALVSGFLMSLFDSQVATQGIYISSLRNDFILRIEAGCNGVEPMIILTAAIVAFSASIKEKAVGLIFGFLGIQGINIIRIISLFYIGQWSMTAYEWAHLYVWQALILIDAFVIWILWVRYLNREQEQPAFT